MIVSNNLDRSARYIALLTLATVNVEARIPVTVWGALPSTL